jgi:hypothetical protein
MQELAAEGAGQEGFVACAQPVLHEHTAAGFFCNVLRMAGPFVLLAGSLQLLLL